MNKDISKLEESDLVSVWKEMEKLVEMGLVRSIGVSNYSIADLEDLLKNCKIVPAVLQIEIHPYNTQEKLINFCKEIGIAIQSYSCLGNPGFVEAVKTKEFKEKLPPLIENELLVNIGKKYGKSGAQVALRWNLQNGNCVIFKTENKERINQNIDILNFELNEEEIQSINKLNADYKIVTPAFHNWTRRYKAI